MDYKIINTESEYNDYCDRLHDLVKKESTRNSDEVELLTLLVEKWSR